MSQRKLYLNPASSADLPYSTTTYLRRSARSQAHPELRPGQQVTLCPDTSLGPATPSTSSSSHSQPSHRDTETSQCMQNPDCGETEARQTQCIEHDLLGCGEDLGTSHLVDPPDGTGTETHQAQPPDNTATDSSYGMQCNDLLALAVNFVIEFGLPWKGVETLQKLIIHILNRHDIPATKYLFKKYVGAGIKSAVFHFYCENCMTLVAETSGDITDRNHVQGTCSVCARVYSGRQMLLDGHFFLTLPVLQELSSLLAENCLASALQERLQVINQNLAKDADMMSDITDGSLYKEFRRKLPSKNDLTLTFNTDGSPVFKSSKFSIWPVQLTVNELPPQLRHKNVLVSALWYGQSHPNMTLLLSAFVKQMEDLASSGVTWKVAGQSVESKVYCFSCSVDSPARAAMQNFTEFNGRYGCAWCLHPGVTVDGTIKYPIDGVHPDRDMVDTKEKMRTATDTGKIVKGVKGPTPLINLPHFDIIWGFTPDYMHCVLLGVTRQLTESWLSDAGACYYIGSPRHLAVLDERLCSIRPHLCISRLPRSLSVRKYWKASEWQHWLLYFSLPCLEGILLRQYFKHFALLVQGISVLLQGTVCNTDLDAGRDCLVKFVVDTQFLYGESQMTYNMHQLLHIAKSVVHQGPLWAHSCFSFESNIGQLKELVTSAKGAPMQIVERLMMASSYKRLKGQASPQTLQFLLKRGPSHSRGFLLLSKPRIVAGPLLEFVQNQIGDINGPVVEHDRICVSGYVFHSEQYTRPHKTNSTALLTSHGICVKIKHIVSFKDCTGRPKIFAISDKFVSHYMYDSQHIMKCSRVQSANLVELEENVTPCIYVECAGQMFFVKLCLKICG